jgi:hypothetical protein
MMTIDQFIARLELKVKRDKTAFVASPCLRTIKHYQCPLNYVARQAPNVFTVHESAILLGLSSRAASQIMICADHDESDNYQDWSPKLRARLLKACGLEAE